MQLPTPQEEVNGDNYTKMAYHDTEKRKKADNCKKFHKDSPFALAKHGCCLVK